MCLRLHLGTLTHRQQRVEVLRLRAHVVQQTGRKCFGVLKTEMVQHAKDFIAILKRQQRKVWQTWKRFMLKSHIHGC